MGGKEATVIVLPAPPRLRADTLIGVIESVTTRVTPALARLKFWRIVVAVSADTSKPAPLTLTLALLEIALATVNARVPWSTAVLPVYWFTALNVSLPAPC